MQDEGSCDSVLGLPLLLRKKGRVLCLFLVLVPCWTRQLWHKIPPECLSLGDRAHEMMPGMNWVGVLVPSSKSSLPAPCPGSRSSWELIKLSMGDTALAGPWQGCQLPINHLSSAPEPQTQRTNLCPEAAVVHFHLPGQSKRCRIMELWNNLSQSHRDCGVQLLSLPSTPQQSWPVPEGIVQSFP